MTSKQRFLAAMRNEVPDRVPVSPDISNYVPARLTGRPFWDIYFHQEIPLWQAYINAADHFGIDMWIASCMDIPTTGQFENVEIKSRISKHDSGEAMIRRSVIRTPDGEMTTEEVCFIADPPTTTQKPIKDFAADWKKFKWLLQPPAALDASTVERRRSECHKRNQAFGMAMGYPGFQGWVGCVQGGVAALTYAYFDTPEILDEWFELDLRVGDRLMELALSARPDYLLFGGSGTITLASPDLAMKFAIPALTRWSKMAADAGVPTMLHSCGKSRLLVDMLAEHTCVNCINPLEVAPMGDVDLAEVKKARGRDIALMGNLHTVNTMLRGSADDVRKAAKQAMQDAGEGGGFILSTGDQVGRDTPDENIFAMVETAHKFGRYDQATGKLPDLI